MNRKRGGQQKEILPLTHRIAMRLTERDYDNVRKIDPQVLRSELVRLAAALAGAPPADLDRIRERIGAALQEPR